MPGSKTSSNLIQVKQDLADKYARLANQTKSTPLRRKFSSRAEHYRRQVEQLKHA